MGAASCQTEAAANASLIGEAEQVPYLANEMNEIAAQGARGRGEEERQRGEEEKHRHAEGESTGRGINEGETTRRSSGLGASLHI